MSNPRHRTHRASLGCQQRAIRIIVHGNTDETFQEEKNTSLGNEIDIINHGQESAINGVCFLLGADHRRLLCSRDGNERLSWCCCQHDLTRVQSNVSRRVWLSPGEKQMHATHLCPSRSQCTHDTRLQVHRPNRVVGRRISMRRCVFLRFRHNREATCRGEIM